MTLCLQYADSVSVCRLHSGTEFTHWCDKKFILFNICQRSTFVPCMIRGSFTFEERRGYKGFNCKITYLVLLLLCNSTRYTFFMIYPFPMEEVDTKTNYKVGRVNFLSILKDINPIIIIDRVSSANPIRTKYLRTSDP